MHLCVRQVSHRPAPQQAGPDRSSSPPSLPWGAAPPSTWLGRLFAFGATASTCPDPGSGRPQEFKGPDRGRQGSLSQPPPPLNRRAHVEPPYCLSFLAHPARESALRLGRDRWLRPPPPS
ncbi:hypothetical protein NDU88_004651 [Pleurodeles waltl]|uniref:Uncharacterized protein n=1 Tax=Pleurodeles waltl TaxID=8319 RepID=A0AAV7VJU4_PLEWA|nr:hypothetical protein NDU88_004651 [Pleurodeles waltl]